MRRIARRMGRNTGLPFLSALLAITASGSVSAQTDMAQGAASVPPGDPAYVRLGPGAPALLFKPAAPGPRATIAVLVMHAGADYLTFSACTELSRRGYHVLCANNATSKTGAFQDGILDRVLGDIRTGVTYLRSLPEVRKVVLFGHSGGATIMTAYQAIAENGVAFCRGPDKVHQCPDTLAGMPAADGVVLADANWGQSVMTLFSIDPSVVDENGGMRRDPSLDLFDPANGFRASGSSYGPAFRAKFLAAVGRRNNALISRAQDRLALIEAGKGMFADDEPFFVPGASFIGSNNKLYPQDTRLLSRSRRAWPLVRKDGSVVTQVIRSVRPPMNTENMTRSLIGGALKTTVRNFLSSYAVKTTAEFGYDEGSAIRGVDWRSSYSNQPGNVEGIRAPLLALGMTGGWEALAAELIYDHAASKDKSIAFIEGATHLYTPCTRCETTPGQFGDTIKTTYDYVDTWLSKPGRLLAGD